MNRRQDELAAGFPVPVDVDGFQCPEGYRVAYDNWDTEHLYPFCVYIEVPPPTTGAFTLIPGSFKVRLAKTSYKAGETVKLNIAYDITKHIWLTWKGWSVNAEVYDINGNLLDKDGEYNALTTVRSISTLANPYVHPTFQMSNIPMQVTVKLKVAYNPTLLSTKEELLGTITVTVPLSEEEEPPPSETFTLLAGSFQVQPDKASYAPGDLVTLNVGYDVSKSGFTWFSWSVNAEVYDSSGVLLDKDGDPNAETSRRSVSTLANPLVHPRFYASNATMQVTVVLTADGLELGSMAVTIPVTEWAPPPDGLIPPPDGEEPVTPPEEGGFPWLWLAAGAGVLAILVVATGKKKPVKTKKS